MICCTSSKKFLRVSRNSFDSMYLYSWQAQTSPLFCGIIHLHSTQIRYVIPILELSEMKKKRLFAAGKTQNFQLNIICPLGLQNLAFFFSPLQAWQYDRKTPTSSRENNIVLHPSPAIKITTQAELSAYRQGFYGLKVPASGRCSPDC